MPSCTEWTAITSVIEYAIKLPRTLSTNIKDHSLLHQLVQHHSLIHTALTIVPCTSNVSNKLQHDHSTDSLLLLICPHTHGQGGLYIVRCIVHHESKYTLHALMCPSCMPDRTHRYPRTTTIAIFYNNSENRSDGSVLNFTWLRTSHSSMHQQAPPGAFMRGTHIID